MPLFMSMLNEMVQWIEALTDSEGQGSNPLEANFSLVNFFSFSKIYFLLSFLRVWRI